MRARGVGFVEEISSRFAGKRILVVTHGYFLGQTLKALFRDESTGNDLRNTSLTTIEHRDGRWNYLLYDCVRHLSDE
jgi:probable phosphoglycerate mutase